MIAYRWEEALKLLIFIALCFTAGLIGSLFTAPAIPTWYAFLKKPPFTPPPGTFGLVWPALYILMGVAAYLVWRKRREGTAVRLPLALFGTQLLLNALWSFLFFGLASPLAGLIEIAALWIALVATVIFFLRVSLAAGLLLVPYLLWITFAAALNFSIWKLN